MELADAALTEEEAGWYYGVWKGVYPLTGQEGVDAELYTPRGNPKMFAAAGMTWYKTLRCAVQLATGDPRSLTSADGSKNADGVSMYTPSSPRQSAYKSCLQSRL